MSSKHFCLKWTKFQTALLNAFESLQVTEDLTDVTLTCEGISIKAHRFILSACSPYFRSIFKENPCSHPIVILKDVAHIDLIAVINFMYHGEVMVSEEQLPSFLQTAMVLQVSGLINTEMPYTLHKPSEIKKSKVALSECPEPCSKKIKVVPKTLPKKGSNDSNGNPEKNSIEEGNKNEESQMQSSILEAALEVKPGSILERSLTSSSGKFPLTCERLNVQSALPDISIPKTVLVPCKLSDDSEKLKLRSSSESSSPSTYDRTSEFVHTAIKVEEPCEMDIEKELIPPEDTVVDFSRTIEIPHHSSQCGNCPHCGKIYSNQSALKYHVRLVHSDLTNMYCCHLCPESFDYREGYKKHMAEVHSVRN